MKTIFKYIDYRRFLEDFYNEKKRTTHSFSYRYFALKAGFKSPVFLRQVITGERNLTRPMIERFVSALQLNRKEATYFKNLVLFNQAATAGEKQEHYALMLEMMDYVNEHQLSADQYAYFEHWYTSAIRELVCLHDFGDDYDLMARSVFPRIRPRDVRHAIDLLLRLNLIAKKPDGTYRQTASAIISDDPMVAVARRSFNSEMLQLAINANNTVPKNERNVSGITMGISKSCYDVIISEVAAFKERIKVIVNRDEGSSRVYQLNMQLFPLSVDLATLPECNDGEAPCGS